MWRVLIVSRVFSRDSLAARRQEMLRSRQIEVGGFCRPHRCFDEVVVRARDVLTFHIDIQQNWPTLALPAINKNAMSSGSSGKF